MHSPSSSTSLQHCYSYDTDGDVQMTDVFSSVQDESNMDEDDRFSIAETLVATTKDVDADGDVEMTDADAFDADEDGSSNSSSNTSTRATSSTSSPIISTAFVDRTMDVGLIESAQRGIQLSEAPAKTAMLTKSAAFKSVSINVGPLRVQYDANEGHVDIQGY